MRPLSKIAPDWWDYTTLDREILDDAARLSVDDLAALAREGFAVKFYDTVEDFYLAEALEYITSWRQATADRPAGIAARLLGNEDTVTGRVDGDAVRVGALQGELSDEAVRIADQEQAVGAVSEHRATDLLGDRHLRELRVERKKPLDDDLLP